MDNFRCKKEAIYQKIPGTDSSGNYLRLFKLKRAGVELVVGALFLKQLNCEELTLGLAHLAAVGV